MHWKNVWSASLVLVLSLASARGRCVQQASPPAPPQDGAAASRPAPAAPRRVTGMIAGKVLLNGIAPARRQIQVTEPRAERPEGQPLLTEDVVLSPAGELRNVVVRIVRGMEGKDFTVPHPTPLLDHSGCQYRPHVLAMLPGQLGVIHNDPFVHNVHASCLLNKPFNKAQAAAGRRDDFPLERPEAVRIACDVHAWEFAWVVVCENPCFAVTADDGSFSFPAPPGTYTVEAWHEKLGTQSVEVTVTAGKASKQYFTFEPRK